MTTDDWIKPMRMPIIPLILMAMPLAEIAGFVIVGRAIGVVATLGLVVLSVVVGLILLRIQGLGILKRISAESRNGGAPARNLVHGAMMVVASILLVIPGFVSDILGLLLFIPAVRDLAWKYLKDRIVVLGSASRTQSNPPRGSKPSGGPVVDLDEGDYKRQPNRNSPWSDGKHIGD